MEVIASVTSDLIFRIYHSSFAIFFPLSTSSLIKNRSVRQSLFTEFHDSPTKISFFRGYRNTLLTKGLVVLGPSVLYILKEKRKGGARNEMYLWKYNTQTYWSTSMSLRSGAYDRTIPGRRSELRGAYASIQRTTSQETRSSEEETRQQSSDEGKMEAGRRHRRVTGS